MLQYAHDSTLGDVVDDFCSTVNLGRGMCDFLRLALDELGFDPSQIENEIRTEGKDQICEQVAELVGADFPGGKPAAKRLCRELLDKLIARFEGGAPPASPRAPRGMTMTAKTTVSADIPPKPPPPLFTAVPMTVRLPAGAITAQDPTDRLFRVAVPKPATAGPGPKFVEVSARSTPPPDVLKVQLRDFLRKTGQLPLYKDPIFWGIAAGAVTVLGGAVYIRRRRARG